MYTYSYLKTAESILSQYNGEVPFAFHLKAYFKLNKKFGGRDRKQIGHFCYCYFRSGKLFKSEPIADKLTKSIFLCTHQSDFALQQINEAYNENATLSIKEKLSFLGVQNSNLVFPFYEHLTAITDIEAFIQGQFSQPFLYVRIRPKALADVLIRLNKLDVSFKIFDPYTVQLPNGFKVEEHFEINKELVVQDYSSQKVFDKLIELLPAKHALKIWDCCAASGGKSILLNDLYQGKLNFYVTDIRPTILVNLEKRFLAAKIMNYKLMEHNLSKQPLADKELFDVVICDAPCSGSGTWARTPEQKLFFKQKQLLEYQETQRRIAANAIKNVKPNGYFVYITCSVYQQENEENVQFLLQKNENFTLVNMQTIEGAANGADTMFVAILLAKNSVI